MGSQELSVSWKDHSSVLVAVFEKLLSNKSLVDCTVAAEGQYLKVHKVVLSACSPYFEVLLNDDIDKHPIIILRDVKFEDLKRIIDFVYRGEVKLPEDQLVEFLNVAESLQIKGLGAGSNDASGKRKFTEDLFARKKTESPSAQKRTRSQLSNTEGKSRESVPSDDLAAHVENAQPSWQPPGSTLVPNNSSSVGTNSITSEFTQNVSNTKTQNDYCASEVTLSTANSVSVSVEPLIPNTRTIVKMELNSDENSEVKDDFGYQTIEDDFPESSYILESDGQGSQPGTSHQYSQMGSSHTSSVSLGTDDTLGGSQGVETGRPEGAGAARGAIETKGHLMLAPYGADALLPPHVPPVRRKPTARACPECGSVINDASNFRKHMLIHTGARPYPCPECGRSFRRLAHLRGHATTHTRYSNAGYCEEEILPDMQRVSASHQLVPSRHQTSSSIPAVSGHKSLIGGRTGRTNVCTVCHVAFAEPWRLRRHMRTHTGEKPFSCNVCLSSFRNKSHLTEHMRIHTGEKPYNCNVCGEAFRYLKTFKEHYKCHFLRRVISPRNNC